MSTADRLTAVVFFALGIAVLIGGYTMDRLAIRQIHPLSIPGLVPMLLGSLLAFCAVLLLVQASPREEREPKMLMVDGSLARLGLTVLLTVAYGGLLVGWLPFFWATAIFISLFTLCFSWSGAVGQRAQVLTALKSAAFGGVASYCVVLLFSEAFLVRLP